MFSGYGSQKSCISIAGTDLEIREDVSSQHTMEPMNDCSILEDNVNEEWSPLRDSLNSRPVVEFKGSVGETTLAEFWRSQYRERQCKFFFFRCVNLTCYQFLEMMAH